MSNGTDKVLAETTISSSPFNILNVSGSQRVGVKSIFLYNDDSSPTNVEIYLNSLKMYSKELISKETIEWSFTQPFYLEGSSSGSIVMSSSMNNVINVVLTGREYNM